MKIENLVFIFLAFAIIYEACEPKPPAEPLTCCDCCATEEISGYVSLEKGTNWTSCFQELHRDDLKLAVQIDAENSTILFGSTCFKIESGSIQLACGQSNSDPITDFQTDVTGCIEFTPSAQFWADFKTTACKNLLFTFKITCK